jgi:adenine-specific DNA methylase
MGETISDLRPSVNARGLSGLTRYGLVEFAQLFNARQTLVLATFSRLIESLFQQLSRDIDADYARAVCTYLAFALDKVADYNSALCTWHNSGEKMGHTYARQAIPMVWDYAESNPFSTASGDWMGAIDWVVRSIEHCSKTNCHPAQLIQGNATRINKPDRSMDAVITDPPYYDSVPYSDLSDFFYVILKRSVGSLHPDILSLPLTPKSAEIIEHARHGDKAKNFYEQQMTLAFGEASRLVTDNGIIAVVFAHTSTAAWETLINSLLNASLIVTASWPLHTEMANRLVAMGNAALASSIFIVCRKRIADEDGFFDDVRREMTARIKERLDFFWSQGIRGADFFISAIGPAVEVFGRYRAVRKLSGEVVTVAVLLDLVQEAVADYTLSRVLNGRYKMGTVDAPTRFYVMYRWSYGGEKLLFDDARRLAQALGAEVSDLTRSGVLKQSGDSVTMPGANERKKQEHLGEAGRDGAAPAVIDVLHRAVLIWQEGDRRALAEYLAQHALGREEEVHAVAQALVNVLPQGDKERQLLENYLQGSSSLPDVPGQLKLL